MIDPNQVSLDKLSDPVFMAEEPIVGGGMTKDQDATYERMINQGFNPVEARLRAARETAGHVATTVITAFPAIEEANFNRMARSVNDIPPFSTPYERGRSFTARSGNLTKRGKFDERIGKGARKAQLRSDIGPKGQHLSAKERYAGPHDR